MASTEAVFCLRAPFAIGGVSGPAVVSAVEAPFDSVSIFHFHFGVIGSNVLRGNAWDMTHILRFSSASSGRRRWKRILLWWKMLIYAPILKSDFLLNLMKLLDGRGCEYLLTLHGSIPSAPISEGKRSKMKRRESHTVKESKEIRSC